MSYTREEFHFALEQILENFGLTKVGAQKVRFGISVLESEIESLRNQL